MSNEAYNHLMTARGTATEARIVNNNIIISPGTTVLHALKEVVADILSWKGIYPQLSNLPGSVEECESRNMRTICLSNQGDGWNRSSIAFSYSKSYTEDHDHSVEDVAADACFIYIEVCVLGSEQQDVSVLSGFQHLQQAPWVLFLPSHINGNNDAAHEAQNAVAGASMADLTRCHFCCAVRCHVECHPLARAFRIHMEQIIGQRISSLMGHELGLQKQEATVVTTDVVASIRQSSASTGGSPTDELSGFSSSHMSSSCSSCSSMSDEEDELCVCA